MKSWRRKDNDKMNEDGDAGAAPAAGDSAGVASGDLGGTGTDVIDATSNDGGISTEDVLGKNVPGEGFFGKDNFYIPFRVKFPLTRLGAAYGGSKRKKTKKGRSKKTPYEQGMKVVVDMLEAEDLGEASVKKVVQKRKVKDKLYKIAKSIKTMDDVEAADRDFQSKKSTVVSKMPSSKQFQKTKNAFLDFGSFLHDICTGKWKASWFTITMLAVGIIYVLSPIDFIPDAIPVIGWIDDAMAINWILAAIKDEFEEWRANRSV